MELKAGYKLTEVGVIPEDWDLVPLSAIGEFKNGINKGADAFGHGSPFVNLMDVFGVSSIKSSERFGLVKTTELEQKTYDLKRGDVIFIRSSVKPSGVGLTAVVETDLPKTVYSGFLIRFRDSGALDIGFKRHCFYAEKFRNKLIGASSVSANTNINQNSLKKLLFALPPTTTEQRAIAEVLSDADALIDSLNQLITKKRNLKQAAMQQLLTGQTRLPGFSGEWEEKSLAELADCLDYLRIPLNESERSKLQGDYPYCGANGVLDYIDKYCVDDDVILMAEDGGYFDEYATRPIAYRMSGKCWVNNHAHILKTKAVFDQGFLFYSLVHKNIQPFLASGTRAKLNKSEMNKITINLPEEKFEQTAIATILSDMDTELAELESRLAKALLIKQGMMQKLLTGRIRLL